MVCYIVLVGGGGGINTQLIKLVIIYGGREKAIRQGVPIFPRVPLKFRVPQPNSGCRNQIPDVAPTYALIGVGGEATNDILAREMLNFGAAYRMYGVVHRHSGATRIN